MSKTQQQRDSRLLNRLNRHLDDLQLLAGDKTDTRVHVVRGRIVDLFIEVMRQRRP